MESIREGNDDTTRHNTVIRSHRRKPPLEDIWRTSKDCDILVVGRGLREGPCRRRWSLRFERCVDGKGYSVSFWMMGCCLKKMCHQSAAVHSTAPKADDRVIRNVQISFKVDGVAANFRISMMMMIKADVRQPDHRNAFSGLWSYDTIHDTIPRRMNEESLGVWYMVP